MAERMRAELESLSLSKHSPGNFNISIAPHGRFAAWVGWSLFASTSTFREMGCSKGRYEEVGVREIHQDTVRFDLFFFLLVPTNLPELSFRILLSTDLRSEMFRFLYVLTRAEIRETGATTRHIEL